MLTYIMILVIIGAMLIWILNNAIKTSDSWECKHCGEEVIGLDFCPYCQNKRGE